MIRTLFSTLFIWAILFSHAVPAYGQSNIDIKMGEDAMMSQNMLPADTGGYEIYGVDVLENMLESAEAVLLLNQTARTIDNGRGCSKHIDAAKDLRRQLTALKQRYRGRADETYLKKDKAIRIDYNRAKNDYEMCFNSQVGTFEGLSPIGVYNLATHKAKTKELMGRVDKSKDISTYIAQLKAALEFRQGKLEQNVIVATITSVFDTVEYKPAKSGNRWLPVRSGHKLKLGDTLRTGPRSRARLRFSEQRNVGPSVINVGPSTEIRMDKFTNTSASVARPQSLVELIRGKLRAFTKNWGFGASFSIRSGTIVIGVRGTEVAVEYDPSTRIAEVHLDHGDAYVEVGGVQTPLQPRTSVTVANNTLSAARPLTDATWGNIVNLTGDQRNETVESARMGAGDDTLDNMSEIPPRIIEYPEIDISRPYTSPPAIQNMAAGLALGYVAKLNQAMIDYDQQTAFKYMDSDFKTRIRSLLQTRSFRQMVNSDGVVNKVENNCSACWYGDANHGEDPEKKYCTVKALLHFEDGHAPQTGMFYLRSRPTGESLESGLYGVYKIIPATPKNLAEFEQRQPFCSENITVNKSVR